MFKPSSKVELIGGHDLDAHLSLRNTSYNTSAYAYFCLLGPPSLSSGYQGSYHRHKVAGA